MYIALSDIHYWKNDSYLIDERIEKITEYLINKDEKEITMFLLWDIIETAVLGWMHPGQIENMDNVYWFNLFMKTVELFEKMLLTLKENWKKVNFIWITWNHDRLESKDSLSYSAWLIIYELLKRWLKWEKNINITYYDEI